MTEKQIPRYEGRNPMDILAEAIEARPIPAIEKPLGLRGTVTLFDTDLAKIHDGWNDQMRGRERG